MKNLDQWVNWRLETRPSQPGKPKSVFKVPYSHTFNRRIDNQDPANWLSYDAARANSPDIAFVLSAQDPYFCVDLDDAYQDDEWSQHSKNILTWFPGAYVEVSHFLKGLHIFGSYHGDLPPHKKRKVIGGHGIELYTSGRMIAFTGHQASGDPDNDLTSQLTGFINAVMFSVSEPGETATPLWDKPDPKWIGPEDDDKLIERMLKSSKSISSTLNKKAGIVDLWSRVVETLAHSYPDPDPSRDYDHSSADSALMSHLAFWTGKHVSRMIRIARQSALVREKWDFHKQYLEITARNACARCRRVYRDPRQVATTGEATTGEATDDNVKMGSQFLDVMAQVPYFKRCVYISDRHAVFTEGAGILKPMQFNAWYGGPVFALDHQAKSTTRKPFDALTGSQGYNFPKAVTSCFRPQYDPGEVIEIDGRSCVNTYTPVTVKVGSGPVDRFLHLLGKLFPIQSDLDIILAYSAACVQYPGVKFRWCPVIQGAEGNGKTIWMMCVAYCIGERYVHMPQSHDLASKFNGWIDGNLLIIVEEMFTENRREVIEVLKPLITNTRVGSQDKGENTKMVDNCANFLMATNHKNALSSAKKSRRYAIFYTPHQTKEDVARDGLTNVYFKGFTDWLKGGGYADVAGFLKRYPIPDDLNPATLRSTAPDTSSTKEAIEISQGAVYEEVKEAIGSGLYGFRKPWISSGALTKLLKLNNISRFLPYSKRKDFLNELGYVPMPWTCDGRATHQLPNEDNIRPTLYVLKNRIYGEQLTTEDYINAQSEIGNEDRPRQDRP